MNTYETKIGTAKITTGRILVNGQWGVMGKVKSREVFIGFTGKPDLEAAFPSPEWMTEKAGPRSDKMDMIYEDMDRAGSNR